MDRRGESVFFLSGELAMPFKPLAFLSFFTILFSKVSISRSEPKLKAHCQESRIWAGIQTKHIENGF